MSGAREPFDPVAPNARRRRRPLGITLLISIYWFWAGAIVVLLLSLVFGDGPVTVYGRAVPRGEVLRSVSPALAPMALAVAGAALALTLARSWARPAAMFPFVLAAFGPALTGFGSAAPAELGLAALVLLPLLGLLVWYLYFRPGPRDYFRRPPR